MPSVRFRAIYQTDKTLCWEMIVSFSHQYPLACKLPHRAGALPKVSAIAFRTCQCKCLQLSPDAICICCTPDHAMLQLSLLSAACSPRSICGKWGHGILVCGLPVVLTKCRACATRAVRPRRRQQWCLAKCVVQLAIPTIKIGCAIAVKILKVEVRRK